MANQSEDLRQLSQPTSSTTFHGLIPSSPAAINLPTHLSCEGVSGEAIGREEQGSVHGRGGGQEIARMPESEQQPEPLR